MLPAIAGFGYGLEASEPKYWTPTPAKAGLRLGFCA